MIVEAPSSEQAFANSEADIVLIPRAVKADQSAGVWAPSKQNSTPVVEWAASDRTAQNTIWLQTIAADASDTMGNIFSYNNHAKQLVQKLFGEARDDFRVLFNVKEENRIILENSRLIVKDRQSNP